MSCKISSKCVEVILMILQLCLRRTTDVVVRFMRTVCSISRNFILFICFIDLLQTHGPYHKHNLIPQEHKIGKS